MAENSFPDHIQRRYAHIDTVEAAREELEQLQRQRDNLDAQVALLETELDEVHTGMRFLEAFVELKMALASEDTEVRERAELQVAINNPNQVKFPLWAVMGEGQA